MKTKILTKWAAMLAVVATCFASAAMAKNFERQFDVREGGLLDLKTDSGSVHIETHDSATALVRVEIGGRDAEDFEVFPN